MKRIGLIGCGRWGRLILRDLLSCGAEVHVVCRTPASNEQALALGARSASPDFARIADLDGFVVATPTATHAAVLEQLQPTGRPVFVEKPMTADVTSARRLAAAMPDRLFVMDKWRYHPGVEAMRAEVASGLIGRVLAIRTLRWGWGNPHKDVSALWILAPHDLAIALHVTGTIPPFRSAVLVTPEHPEMGLSANFGATGEFALTLDLSTASPDHRRWCTVIGEKATLELRNGYDREIFVREGAPGAAEPDQRSIHVGSRMPLLTELESFLGFLSGGPPPRSSAAEGLLVVERVAKVEAALAEQIRSAS